MIIGLTGPKRCGKDTVANLIMQHNTSFYPLSFAWPIKQMVMEGLGLSMEQVNGDLKDMPDPVFGCTPRHILQTLGTEWGRELINESIWLLIMEQRIQNVGKDIVITDVRFENEASWIRAQENGKVVHITGRVKSRDAHKSEGGVQFVSGKDGIIENNRTLDHLSVAVQQFLIAYYRR